MPIAQINAQGIDTYTIAENQVSLATQMRALFGQELSSSVQTPQGQLVGLLALIQSEINESIVAVGNSMSVENAFGVQLDSLGKLLDVRREPATATTLEVVVSGIPGTVIPEGSLVSSAAGTFRTLGDVTLTSAPVAVNIEATVPGRVEVPANTVDTIVSLIAGWESVNNPAEASLVGSERQTDAEYRIAIRQKSSQNAYGGPTNSIGASVIMGGAEIVRMVENNTAATVTTQEWPIPAHSVLVLTDGGSAADITRAIEGSRGLGVGVVTSYRSSEPADDSVLNAINNGSITWNGVAYPGLDLTAADDGPKRAAALTALLPIDVVWIDGRFEAIFGWASTSLPAFGTGSVETALGFAAPSVTPPGPFVQARYRDVTIHFTVRRDADTFPADGLNQIRQLVTNRVAAYDIGEQFWSNDILSTVESIPGTRVTTPITATYLTEAVSGADVPVNIKWRVLSDDLTVTLTT